MEVTSTTASTTATATKVNATTTTVSDRLSPRAKKDYELVQAAIKGDQNAYELLLNRYRHSIFHTMLKMVHNRQDADDLTIEAFGKAFNKLPTYAPHFAFSTWLFKIAINNCIDHIRKKRIKTLSIDEPIEFNGAQDFSSNLKSGKLNPEEEIIRNQRIGLMRSSIQKLSIKYRLMIELRYFEGLSYDEIAKELGIPLGTVKAQLFRAKEILFQMMQKPMAAAYLESTQRYTAGRRYK